MARTNSELQVITFAKNLCSYVMTVTQKSPKQFEQISLQCFNTQNLLGAWIISDQKRLNSGKQKQEPTDIRPLLRRRLFLIVFLITRLE